MDNIAKVTDRFLAYLIDTLPFLAGFHASLYLLAVKLSVPLSVQTWRRALAAWACAYVLYHWMGNMAGATWGKKALGLRVVDREGASLGAAASLIRAAGLLISTPLLNMGFLWALVQPDSRTWHDLLAGSWVVEVRPKSRGESARSALIAFLALGAVLGWMGWLYSIQPTPEDLAAVRKAREGLDILAQIEERHKARYGTFTDDLGELALDSGGEEEFRAALLRIFDPRRFAITASRDHYFITARARDRRGTAVSVSGP